MKLLTNPFFIACIAVPCLIYAFIDMALAENQDFDSMTRSGQWAARMVVICLVYWLLVEVIKSIQQNTKQ